MNDPLFWNPLPLAAEWLSNHTGERISPLQLIDMVARQGEPGTPKRTIVKALLPVGVSLAVVRMFDSPDVMDHLREQGVHKAVASKHGEPPFAAYRNVAYIQVVHSDVAPLCANQLLDLVLRGTTDVAMLQHGPGQWRMTDLSEHDSVWLLPMDRPHQATIETCGINRADLQALAASVVPTRTTELPAVTNNEQGDTKHSWIAVARQYADEAWKSRVKNTNPSARDIAERIAKRFKDEGIQGKRGTLAAPTIERQALRGWEKPTR